MRNFYQKVLNFKVLLAVALIFLFSTNRIGTRNISARVIEEKPFLALSQLGEIDQKLLRMKLRKTGKIRYSRASWYGGYFHGRTTANMEIFNKNLLSAAHKTLPINTYLLVTNLDNERQVIVRVNDRGPYVRGRDIDLSEAAAKVIDSHSKGIAKIKYEILDRA